MANTRWEKKQTSKRVLLAVIRPGLTRISGVVLKEFCLSVSVTRICHWLVNPC